MRCHCSARDNCVAPHTAFVKSDRWNGTVFPFLFYAAAILFCCSITVLGSSRSSSVTITELLITDRIYFDVRPFTWTDGLPLGQNGNGLKTDKNGNHTVIKRERNGIARPVVRTVNGNFVWRLPYMYLLTTLAGRDMLVRKTEWNRTDTSLRDPFSILAKSIRYPFSLLSIVVRFPFS